jgi:hypothetical protein
VRQPRRVQHRVLKQDRRPRRFCQLAGNVFVKREACTRSVRTAIGINPYVRPDLQLPAESAGYDNVVGGLVAEFDRIGIVARSYLANEDREGKCFETFVLGCECC